jgi:hypothetical protein
MAPTAPQHKRLQSNVCGCDAVVAIAERPATPAAGRTRDLCVLGSLRSNVVFFVFFVRDLVFRSFVFSWLPFVISAE